MNPRGAFPDERGGGEEPDQSTQGDFTEEMRVVTKKDGFNMGRKMEVETQKGLVGGGGRVDLNWKRNIR